jgi:DNA repair photolyase
MRWQAQQLDDGDLESPTLPTLPGLPRLAGLRRTVTTPDFAGVRFHEVTARSALNPVPAASAMPFRWTINPYRGCTHACVYCFARGSHSWLELDPGRGFDTELVVKVNLVEVLARELSRPSWTRELVALGTNTDPYQRAEGRYRLMPGVIRALAGSGTPISILTKGTLLRRDLPLLADAAARVPVGIGVSLAIWDDELHQALEPGTPSPRARLELVAAVRRAGLPCGVFIAPVLPGLTDSDRQLQTAVARAAEAGATGVTVIPLHLRPGAREWFGSWLADHRPELVPRYRAAFGSGSYQPAEHRRRLAERVAPILARHGLSGSGGGRGVPGDPDAGYPAGVLPTAAGQPVADRPAPDGSDQLTLL